METRAWFQCYGNKVSHDVQNDLSRSLRELGISLLPDVHDSALPLGVIFVGEFDEGLLELVMGLSQRGSKRVLTVTGSGVLPNKSEAWRILRAGASDVLIWQNNGNAAQSIAARLNRWALVESLMTGPYVRNHLIGQSPAWKATVRQVVEIAHLSDASLLILGESGTGKELVAHLVHALDPRANKKELVLLDCGTLAPELVGSEFFGHERGAFTGAVNARDGAFAMADGGTLFLDEIGELPLPLQPQLLRVVQERTYKRVGGNVWNRTDFRLVCATNRELTASAERGDFRPDLYYRVANWICRLPPLRERKEDVLPLTHHFLKELRPADAPYEIDEPVRQYLTSRDYPGNVRELKQLICRICYRHVGAGPITLGDIPEDERPTDGCWCCDWRTPEFDRAIQSALMLGVGLKEISRTATESAIRIAMNEEEGNLQRAAKKLGVTDRALQLRRANQQSND